MNLKKNVILMTLIGLSFCACQTTQTPQSTEKLKYAETKKGKVTKISSIIYKTTYRRGQKVCTVTPDSLIIMQNKHKQKQELFNDWGKVMENIDTEWVKNIPNVEAPSKGFATDLDNAANLIVIMNGEKYKSQTFDESNPPKEFQEVLASIVEKSK